MKVAEITIYYDEDEFPFHHDDYDGISFMKKLLKKFGIEFEDMSGEYGWDGTMIASMEIKEDNVAPIGTTLTKMNDVITTTYNNTPKMEVT